MGDDKQPADGKQHEIDAATGISTTGHEWDGVRELNNPLPRWWLWLFYITIIWSIGYWIVYPSWPLMSSASQGMLKWHAREALVSDLESLKLQRGPMFVKLAAASLPDVATDPVLLDFARALGREALPTIAYLLRRRRRWRQGLWNLRTTIGCGAAAEDIA
jgi:cytochrome c oxidase cbb3-type subunit 3